MKESIKFSRSEKALYDAWTADYRNIMAQLGAIINDNVTMRLADIARDHGIDLESGDWDFNHKDQEFVKVEKPKEVTPLIPGKETVKTEE